ncbi:hypothetical protein D3C75_356780 [compost metagenome]
MYDLIPVSLNLGVVRFIFQQNSVANTELILIYDSKDKLAEIHRLLIVLLGA